MTGLTLWLLLTLDGRTRVLDIQPTRELCEQAQVSEFLAGTAARCQSITIQPKGPVQ
jgi:hypothetical protein